MAAVMISDSLRTFYCHQIGQVIEIELKKWKKRAVDHHEIKLSWSPEGLTPLRHDFYH